MYQPDIVRSAEPQLFGVSQQGKAEIVLGPDGRPLAKAPAMLLTSAKGKGKWKGKDGVQPADGKKRKKKKKVSVASYFLAGPAEASMCVEGSQIVLRRASHRVVGLTRAEKSASPGHTYIRPGRAV